MSRTRQTKPFNRVLDIEIDKLLMRNARMHQIRWKIENFSKVLNTKLTYPNFHLTPSCLLGLTCYVSLDHLNLKLINKTEKTIHFLRTVVVSDGSNKVLHEEKDEIEIEAKGNRHGHIIQRLEKENVYANLANDMLIIDIWIIKLKKHPVVSCWCVTTRRGLSKCIPVYKIRGKYYKKKEREE